MVPELVSELSMVSPEPGRFFTIKHDLLGLTERAGGEGLGDLQTLRLIQS